MNTATLVNAINYLLTNATNAQKQAFFETLESEGMAGLGEGLPFDYDVWFDNDGVEHLDCHIHGITSFTFHY